MISRVWHIAANTFREAVRDRVLYNLVFFALLMVGSAPLFGKISIGVERIVLINLGLTAISIFGVVIAIFIGIGLVSKEIDKRTLYTVLSRPVRRWEFIFGKYFGLAGTLVVNTFFMTIGVLLALLYVNQKLEAADGQILVAVYFIVLQFFMMVALTLLFSTFSSPIFAALFAFAMFVIGSLVDDLRGFGYMAEGLQRYAVLALSYVVPDFSSLNIISQTAHGKSVSAGVVLQNTVYAILYSVVALSGAVVIFERRDMK